MKTNHVKFSFALVLASMVAACSGEGTPDAQPAGPTTAQVPEASNAVAVPVTPYAAAPTTPGGNCALDAVHGAPASGATVAAGAEAVFSGWFADQANQVPAEAQLVFKSADGQSHAATLVAGMSRPDVAAALNAEALGTSGYNVLIKLDLAPGTYGLSIVHGAEGQLHECPIASTLVVTQ